MPAAEQAACAKPITAADVMHKNVEPVGRDLPAAEAARILCERSARHLVIVDERRCPVGIVSLRDILNGCSEEAAVAGTWSPAAPIGQLIHDDPVTVAPDRPLEDVKRLLGVVGCLPVIDGSRRLLGIIEPVNVVRWLLQVPRQETAQFEVFQPDKAAQRRRNLLAYIRRSSGSLVLPVDVLGSDVKPFARLGYDATSGKIQVQLLTEAEPGAFKIKRTRLHDGHYIVIDANQFVEHFRIDFEGRAYKITEESGALVLTPGN